GGLAHSSSTTSCELYDPASGAWSHTGALPTAVRCHTATLLPSGPVLVAGGIGNFAVADTEIYIPTLGIWMSTGSLITPQFEHTATLLRNGEVLIAAGYVALASAELGVRVGP